MEIDRETLLKLAREDCRIRADWLQIWTDFAEEALEKGEFWEVLYGFLFWAETESQRRRAYLASVASELAEEEPEAERKGARVLWELEKRRMEFYRKRRKKPAREP